MGVVLLAILYYNEVLIYFITTNLHSYSALFCKPDPMKKGSLFMVKVLTEQGEIGISNAVFTTITGAAATNCFGVKGMAYRSMTDGIVHLLRPEAMSKGVKVTYNDDNTVSIELHIIVENGVNIATVCRSIMGEVKYVVSKNTGVEVRDVNVCVDSITM